MTIHSEHPFLPPESDRGPLRRFRGRLPSPVTLWTSGTTDRRAGLTVSSMLVADGDPGYLVGIIDPLSDLRDVLEERATAVVTVLDWQHRQLADKFGYVAPAPGGPFAAAEWRGSDWGPVLLAEDGQPEATWAGCRLRGTPEELGWGLQVRLAVEHVELGPGQTQPLIHRRGRYYTG